MWWFWSTSLSSSSSPATVAVRPTPAKRQCKSHTSRIKKCLCEREARPRSPKRPTSVCFLHLNQHRTTNTHRYIYIHTYRHTFILTLIRMHRDHLFVDVWNCIRVAHPTKLSGLSYTSCKVQANSKNSTPKVPPQKVHVKLVETENIFWKHLCRVVVGVGLEARIIRVIMDRVSSTAMIDAGGDDDGEYQLKSFSFDVDMGSSIGDDQLQASKKIKTGTGEMWCYLYNIRFCTCASHQHHINRKLTPHQ